MPTDFDFSYNNSTILTTGGFRPNRENTPLDSRTIVNTKADIANIPLPFIGMEITVLQDETNNDKMTVYKIKALTSNNTIDISTGIEEITVPTKVSELENDSQYITESSMAEAINENKIYKVTTAEYNNLSEEDKAGKLFLLTDYEEEQFSLSYSNNVLSLLKGNIVISQVTINSISDSGGTTDIYGNIILSISNTQCFFKSFQEIYYIFRISL